MCVWWGSITKSPTCGDSDLQSCGGLPFLAFWTCIDEKKKKKHFPACILEDYSKLGSFFFHTIDWTEMSSVVLKKLVLRGGAGLRGEILTAYLNRRWLYGCEVPGRFLRAAVVGPREATCSQQCVFSGTCEQTGSSCSNAAVQQLAFFEQLGCRSDTQQTKRFLL